MTLLNWLYVTFLFGQIFCHTEADAETGEDLRQPCIRKRTEIAFPIVRDASGTVHLSQGAPEPRGLLHLQLSWRRRKLEVLLYKNQVTSPATHSEWTEGNVTFAWSANQTCFYQGYVKGQRSSFVALSTCAGLSGYIQTDTEMLFIEAGGPTSEAPFAEGPQKRLPHLVYTCEGPSRPTLDNNFSTASHQKRVRRAAKAAKYLEVKLVVDYSLWNLLGGREITENYVMTLMNIANTVFQHKSLDVNLRVVVTKLIFLEQRDSRRVQTRNRALDSVNKFCAWSMAQIPAGQTMDYDIAVLITKEKLGPSGYAPITGLCNPVRSCAVIVDEGFTTGFVIAHESAHVFGLFHDGHGNNCYGRKYQTSLMAPLVESRLNHFWWSECSRSRMKEIINYLYCLNNEPEVPEDHYPLEATAKIQPKLGKPWSLEFQCRREFGQRYSLCGAFYNDPCNVLWCSASSHGMCRTKRGPPMPGSPCGSNRECRNGRCTYVGNERPVNGHWGSWTTWSDCSTDCGVGVKRRTRACDNPEPQYGGKKCEGETESWDTCVVQKCEVMEDMRKGECNVWDSLQIRYGTHSWQPFQGQNETSLCKQTCRSYYTSEVVTIDVDVVDGTPCSYTSNNSNVCVLGVCRIVGCDGKLNSTKTRDACGLCGGDGSNCKVVAGKMALPVKSATQYQRVMTIPSGARSIRVEKLTRGYQFLALQDPRYGSHPLNREKRQASTTSLVINGAMFFYVKQNTTHNESISSPGPLFQPLEVEFYPNNKHDPVNVSYAYTVHKSDFTFEKEKFKWKFDKWSGCSVTCGQGHQQILHKCIDKDSQETVEEDFCRFTKKPRQDKVTCSREKCGLTRYNWAMLNEYSECNATCGETGQQVQNFHCEIVHIKDNYAEAVALEACSHLDPPHYPRQCKGPPCKRELVYRWSIAGNWSDCPCGRGKTQSRQVACEMVELLDGEEGEVEVVEGELCLNETEGEEKPEDSRPCDGGPCPPVYRWIETGRYTDCSAACGGMGHQRSILGCEEVIDGDIGEDGEEKQASISMVRGIVCWKKKVKRPKVVPVPCMGGPCQVFGYQWQATEEWSKCKAKCKRRGTQERRYQCQRVDMTTRADVTNVTDALCGDIPAPAVERRSCTGQHCPLKWTLGKWSECTVTCGRGKMYRTVHCGDKDTDLDDVRCTAKPPRTSRLCKRPPCPVVSTPGCKDKFSFCKNFKATMFRCKRAAFNNRCCGTCEAARQRASSRPKNALERLMKKRGLGKWARRR